MVILIALAKPLGWYMARVYEGRPIVLDRLLGPV
jgi:K+-transporting ATPase ATPase A chain